jgi:diadenosine hexaphosphate hydrolase (ATP-forming)
MKSGRDNAGAGREFSAGGVVTRRGQVLLVKVTNLRGEKVWTFPKGHLEEGESPRETALREVEEETGYRCRILRRLLLVRYAFRREGRLIRKKVQWYWMEPGFKVGDPDAAEVDKAQWVSFEKAEKMVRYPSDFELLTVTRALAGGRRKPGEAGT